MEDVVVFPCVPATAIVRRVAAIAASVSALRSTGIPRSRAASSSGFVDATAVDVVTASTSPTLAASWPTVTCTPSARRRSSPADALRSLPDTT